MRASNQEKNSYVRRQILHTLLEMMREQEFQDIVISRLTARAGVGRASFLPELYGQRRRAAAGGRPPGKGMAAAV